MGRHRPGIRGQPALADHLRGCRHRLRQKCNWALPGGLIDRLPGFFTKAARSFSSRASAASLATTLGPSHQSYFEGPAKGMRMTQHVLRISYISLALLTKCLSVPLVARGTVLLPNRLVLHINWREQWDAVGQLLYCLAVNGERSERHRLFETQHVFRRGCRRLARIRPS